MNLFVCILAFSISGLSLVLLAEAIKDKSFWSFIGLLQKRGAGIAKSVWTKSGYAKSAFKEHTGVYFGEQDRYIIKEIR